MPSLCCCKNKHKVMAMIKRLFMTVIFLLSMSVVGLPETHAFDRSHKVTPYGAFCDHVSHYGKHKSIINMKHANEALQHYYGTKGLNVEIVSKQGRFLKVKIHNEGQLVDTIIFDRQSGRMRSIH
jgi:hypothetical protein